MKRADFKKIIKIRSFWQIDKRKGNYILPSGKHLKDYLEVLIFEQMGIDKLCIRSDGDLVTCAKLENGIIKTLEPFKESEKLTEAEHEKRIAALVNEMIF